ncbi:transmembrane protease serine 9-like [Malaya genurostris]|uniref:transmembrane protease serine 9-like n=1 Tax=Malaya genurostris TaxID=325434 RepID=UPI0026F39B3C|nr:transmembrane protease serine 9-like [Malaya genurostris]
MSRLKLVLCLIVVILRIARWSKATAVECGVPQIGGNELIVHGQETAPGDWPWHVALYHRKARSIDYACGGTIISEQFVLTAAHCVMNKANGFQLSPNRVFVRMGIHDLEQFDPKSAQHHEVGKIHKFANYSRLIDDIALLELSTIIRFNEYVQPACVNLEPNITGVYGTVVGWGLTEDDETAPVLKRAEMPVIDPLTCLKSDRVLFGQTLHEGLFCAGYTNGTSVCNGDSGGGLFIRRANTWFVSGIVSFSQIRAGGTNYCYTKGYGAFTRVERYLAWIREITGMALVPESEVRVCDIGSDSDTSEINFFPRHCGVYLTSRVVGGQNARVFEFPWMALVATEERMLCAGTLINQRYVLTAAHCIRNPLPDKVILGEHTIGQGKDCNENNDCALPVREYSVACVIVHPGFSFRRLHNDIALLRLTANVTFEDHIQPICLPHTEELRRYQPPRYIVSGWVDDSNALWKEIMSPIEPSICEQNINSSRIARTRISGLVNGQICAEPRYPKLTDSCSSDSGAPLGWGGELHGTRFVQFGVTSFTISCVQSSPTVYSNVSHYMPWIYAMMAP